MPQLGDSIVFDNVVGLDEGDVITIPDDDDIVEIIEDLFQLDEVKCMYCGKVFKRNSNKHFHEKHCITSNKQPLEISESITQTGQGNSDAGFDENYISEPIMVAHCSLIQLCTEQQSVKMVQTYPIS